MFPSLLLLVTGALSLAPPTLEVPTLTVDPPPALEIKMGAGGGATVAAGSTYKVPPYTRPPRVPSPKQPPVKVEPGLDDLPPVERGQPLGRVSIVPVKVPLGKAWGKAQGLGVDLARKYGKGGPGGAGEGEGPEDGLGGAKGGKSSSRWGHGGKGRRGGTGGGAGTGSFQFDPVPFDAPEPSALFKHVALTYTSSEPRADLNITVANYSSTRAADGRALALGLLYPGENMAYLRRMNEMKINLKDFGLA